MARRGSTDSRPDTVRTKPPESLRQRDEIDATPNPFHAERDAIPGLIPGDSAGAPLGSKS